METEKEGIQKKIGVAQERLLKVEGDIIRLAGLIGPLSKQMDGVQTEKKYLEGRIIKLTRILKEK